MTFQSAQNAAYSLVATAPSTPTGGTSLVVTAGEGARFSGITTPFYATVWATGAQPVWAAGSAAGGNFEIVQVTNVSTDTLTIVRAREGTTARTILVGDQIAETWTAATFRNAQNLPRSARSSNTILGIADGGTVICATAAYTQTLTAAATLGAGWWVIVKNDTADGTTVLTLDPNASETIDGLTTATMYSGETRLIECDGANFTSQMMAGGYAKFTPTGGNFIVPAGIIEAEVVCVGSGGQGGGGASSVSTACTGGGGGGGGAVSRAIIRGSDLTAGATVVVTVPAGGSSLGTGGTTRGSAGANAGADGSDGSVTTFGTWLKAGGGGGGKAGTNSTNQGGAGGSAVNSAVTVTAGAPASGGSAATAIASQGCAPNTAGNFNGNGSEWGGASGGCGVNNASGGKLGGSSIYGGPGGGSGGNCSTTNGGAGGNGGATQSVAAGGGASGGNGGATTTGGGTGTFTGPFCGAGGGGGGGGNNGVAGKDGGPGGIGAGGGGGGCSSSATSAAAGGNGGAGGAGEARIWYR